jgi:hypothetical protein
MPKGRKDNPKLMEYQPRAILEPLQEVVESDESVVIPLWVLDSQERPMWKPEHRIAADRRGLRYPSDMSDASRH